LHVSSNVAGDVDGAGRSDPDQQILLLTIFENTDVPSFAAKT
jgi:hypothetical protein